MAEQSDALTKGQAVAGAVPGVAPEARARVGLADMIAEDAANRARVGALTAMASLTRVPASARPSKRPRLPTIPSSPRRRTSSARRMPWVC